MSWILEFGLWNDAGQWDDAETWNDQIPKPNIQKFIDDDSRYTDGMFDVINQPNVIQQYSLWTLKDTFATSAYFGGIIWDNNLSDLTQFFTREYWIANFTAIMSALGRVGTYDAYYEIIVSALGVDTLVKFESDQPSHLRILIQSGTAAYFAGALKGNEIEPLVTHDGTEIIFAKTLSPLTVYETEALIKLLVPNGIWFEWNEAVLGIQILINPADQIVVEGQTATFTADATNYDSILWWYSDDQGATWIATGGTALIYEVITTLANDGRLYRAIFTNEVTQVATTSAQLTVTPI